MFLAAIYGDDIESINLADKNVEETIAWGSNEMEEED